MNSNGNLFKSRFNRLIISKLPKNTCERVKFNVYYVTHFRRWNPTGRDVFAGSTNTEIALSFKGGRRACTGGLRLQASMENFCRRSGDSLLHYLNRHHQTFYCGSSARRLVF